MKTDGKVLFKSNDKVIQKVTHLDGSRTYTINEMHKVCYLCDNKVHKDSGKLYMNKLMSKMFMPRFLCKTCYKIAKVIERSINRSK